MEITYIGHSGFFIEWEHCCWLFDYYKGEIPEINPGKELIVFVSHQHGDRYNPEIFSLSTKYNKVQYVLSSDINSKKINYKGMEVTGTGKANVPLTSVKPYGAYELYDLNGEIIQLKTLKSTDCGVAFLLQYQGKTIYHAGDLNLWVWKEESKQYNNNMTARFNKEMEKLKDTRVDIAFAPLDPRQEEYYYLGLKGLLDTARIQYVFPMHFWEKPGIIQQFKTERAMDLKKTVIMDINHEGQKWKL